ncbi:MULTISPECIES: acyltransferase [Virgibacillus]|uniref:Fucose 4-O-acetylase n=2 Tax=Virgibacillus TaxID=84406 RepID=A0A024Q750_9BACI|nr:MULTISPECIES: acyltransferase [Virgibacillus]EQB38143.1 hypothetical protein M948_06095 [Virgibacillus sp. CM-4]MYL40849.1 acyltransferase family protein [Virgibacillus massiliensis]GGJ52268.1 fucose 4-O-acetylase [Virgibacillus kapii]CDQ38353.1 Fucose 4-O-acetylase [Virgibacillus massiliensis]
MGRNYSIDYFKFYAIFAVVCIHTGTLSDTKLGNIAGDDIDFVIDTLARFAVPFFFVVSGYLFISKLKSIQQQHDKPFVYQWAYFKKYTWKLVKLWLAWFFFYYLFSLGIKFIDTPKTIPALQEMFWNYTKDVFTLDLFYYGAGFTQYHLWFLLALIWSVSLLFLFTKCRLLRILFLISLGLNLVGLFGQSYTSFFEVPINTRDTLFFALFYISLGGIFAQYVEKWKKLSDRIPVFIYVGLLLLFAITQVGEGFITLRLMDGEEGNYYLSTIPFLVTLFLFILRYDQIGKGSLISKIGSNAVGIYVSHVFVMESVRMLMKSYGYQDMLETLEWNLLFTPLVFILAYLMYSGLQKGKLVLKNRISMNVPACKDRKVPNTQEIRS